MTRSVTVEKYEFQEKLSGYEQMRTWARNVLQNFQLGMVSLVVIEIDTGLHSSIKEIYDIELWLKKL